jgi:hypothetical protein
VTPRVATTPHRPPPGVSGGVCTCFPRRRRSRDRPLRRRPRSRGLLVACGGGSVADPATRRPIPGPRRSPSSSRRPGCRWQRGTGRAARRCRRRATLAGRRAIRRWRASMPRAGSPPRAGQRGHQRRRRRVERVGPGHGLCAPAPSAATLIDDALARARSTPSRR